MAGNLKHLKFNAQKIARGSFFNKEVRFRRFDFELKSEAAEKFAVRNHWCSYRVTSDLTTESSLDFRNVLNMIDVTVRQEQQLEVDILGNEPIARTVRYVEQDPALRRF